MKRFLGQFSALSEVSYLIIPGRRLHWINQPVRKAGASLALLGFGLSSSATPLRRVAITALPGIGLLEMCWHLCSWVSLVEALEPAALRDMVHDYRLTFDALP